MGTLFTFRGRITSCTRTGALTPEIGAGLLGVSISIKSWVDMMKSWVERQEDSKDMPAAGTVDLEGTGPSGRRDRVTSSERYSAPLTDNLDFPAFGFGVSARRSPASSLASCVGLGKRSSAWLKRNAWVLVGRPRAFG